MISLDELFETEGVTAIARLDDLGRIVDWKAKGAISHDLMETTSNFLAAVTATLQQEARIAARNWSPLRSWTYSGGDMTLIVYGDQSNHI